MLDKVNSIENADVQLLKKLAVRELDDSYIDIHLCLMRAKFPHIRGLQSPVYGSCIKGSSLPKFDAVGINDKFLQILHTPRHWIVATNLFTVDTHDVFLYDSLVTHGVQTETVTQKSSILRADHKKRCITFHLRKYQQQSPSTLMCGYYAIAAAYAACNGVDLSGHVLDDFRVVPIAVTILSHFRSFPRIFI